MRLNVPPAEFGREPSSVASMSFAFLPKPCVRVCFYVSMYSSVQPYLHSHSNSLLNVAVGRFFVVVVDGF